MLASEKAEAGGMRNQDAGYLGGDVVLASSNASKSAVEGKV